MHFRTAFYATSGFVFKPEAFEGCQPGSLFDRAVGKPPWATSNELTGRFL